jgi:threonine aldolase
MIFVTVSDEFRQRIEDAGYFVYQATWLGDDIVRFVTNWATTAEEVDSLLAALQPGS